MLIEIWPFYCCGCIESASAPLFIKYIPSTSTLFAAFFWNYVLTIESLIVQCDNAVLQVPRNVTKACQVWIQLYLFVGSFREQKVTSSEKKNCNDSFICFVFCFVAGAKPFACDQCGAQFSQEDALEAHRQTHTGRLLKMLPKGPSSF